jgi:hypothetical protein
MAVEDDQYSRIIEMLASGLPNLAEQLIQEIRYGRAVSEKGLRAEGRYEEKADLLARATLPSLGATDVAPIPYEAGERIELVREALLTLAETMYGSRRAVLELAQQFDAEPVVRFGDPEIETPSRVDLVEETERMGVVVEAIRALLGQPAGLPQ